MNEKERYNKYKTYYKKYRLENREQKNTCQKQYEKRTNYAATREFNLRCPWASSYNHAKQRCTNTRNNRYKRYGGRGIKFFMNKDDFKFLWYRDKAFTMDKPSIDRINNDGHYVFNNCRFVELIENQSGRI